MKNKVVILTGASSGIGKACAQEFCKQGARLMLAARNEEKLKELNDILNQSGGQSNYMVTDVSNELDCKNMINKTIEIYGSVDVLINNAGISMRAIFNDLDIRAFENVMKVNFYGTIYCTKYALPHILKSKGSVVGV